MKKSMLKALTDEIKDQTPLQCELDADFAEELKAELKRRKIKIRRFIEIAGEQFLEESRKAK